MGKEFYAGNEYSSLDNFWKDFVSINLSLALSFSMGDWNPFCRTCCMLVQWFNSANIKHLPDTMEELKI